MSYSVIAVPRFRKELKKLVRKYPSLKDEFAGLVERLETDPGQGTAIGKNCYKIRLAITHIVIADTVVYLLAIYDKADKENLTDKELAELLELVR